MTAVDELRRVDELTDGTGGSVDAVMGAAIGPYRKSRLTRQKIVGLRLRIALLLVLAAVPAYGETRRVIVLDFANTTKDAAVDWLGPAAAEDITTRLHAVRSLKLVERAQLYRVLQEQKLSLSDLVDPAGAVKLGKLVSAEHVVIGSYTVFGGTVRMNARFVDVETGGISATSQVNGQIDPQRPNALWALFDQLTQATIDSINAGSSVVKVGATSPSPERKIVPTAEEQARLTTPSTGSLQAQESHGRGLVAFRQNQWPGAIQEFERAVSIDPLFAAAWMELSEVLQRASRYPEALTASEKAYRLYVATGDERSQARAVISSGEVRAQQGRYVESLELLQKGREMTERLQDRLGEAEVLAAIGAVHYKQGRFAEALPLFQQALRLAVQEGDTSKQTVILNNVGSTQVKLGQHGVGLQRLEEALLLAEKTGDEKWQTVILNQVGVAFRASGRPAEGLPYYIRAVRISERLGDVLYGAVALSNIAGELYRQGRYAEALTYMETAVASIEKIDSPLKNDFRRQLEVIRKKVR
jgi:tetratricopeptide (TPR) repeat protein